jgi:hypothetical protein
MKSLGRLRPSPAMVVACIALAVALGGTSYAAINLPKNSVGTKQLKKNAVTGPKVKANAITSPKVANNALTGADVNEATLATVPSATTAGTAAPSGAASGDLTGTYPGPTIAANAVTSAKVMDAAQANGLRKADIGAVSTIVNFDPPNIAAGSCDFDSVPVPGAAVNDVLITHPVSSVWGSLIYAPWATVADLVYIRICNPTGVAINGQSLPFHVLLIR